MQRPGFQRCTCARARCTQRRASAATRCFTPSAQSFIRKGGGPFCAPLIEDNETCVEPRPNVTLVNRYSDFRQVMKQPKQPAKQRSKQQQPRDRKPGLARVPVDRER